MPIYEYRCSRCGRTWSKVWKAMPAKRQEGGLRCKACGSGSLRRVLSPFSKPKSEEQRLESLADPSALSGLDESDPRSLARLMRKIGEETGEALEGEEAEMLERMEAGEMPGEDSASSGRGGGDEFL